MGNSKGQKAIPKLNKRQLEKLLDDWSAIANKTLECQTCDEFYETPYEWLSKVQRRAFIDHLFYNHIRPKKSKPKAGNQSR